MQPFLKLLERNIAWSGEPVLALYSCVVIKLVGYSEVNNLYLEMCFRGSKTDLKIEIQIIVHDLHISRIYLNFMSHTQLRM